MIHQPLIPPLDGWGHASLAELNDRAPLLDRQENKYLVSSGSFRSILADLRDGFDVLAIDETSVFTYETTYYDTDDLLAYRQHAQDKRRRLKVRSRCYLDSGECFFEVKLKGPRGRTIKERISYDDQLHGSVDLRAIRFVDGCVQRAYGRAFAHRLSPQLTMQFRRVTLVSRGSAERVTADFDLQFAEPGGATVIAPSDAVVIEVKSEHGHGEADRAIRRIGVRPTRCSKYCIGLNLVRGDLRYNSFKRTLTAHFGWSPPRGAPAESPGPSPSQPSMVSIQGPRAGAVAPQPPSTDRGDSTSGRC